MNAQIGEQPNVIDALGSNLLNATSPILPAFSEFVSEHSVRKWIIYSDYSTHDTFPNDAFVFTVTPAEHLMFSEDYVKKGLPCDLKDLRTRSWTHQTQFLSERNRFTFGFVVPKGSRLLQKKRDVQESLDNTLVLMRERLDLALPHHSQEVKKFKRTKQDVQSSSFKIGLFNRATLVPAFAAFVAMLLVKHTPVDHVGWFSDRDPINTTWNDLTRFAFDANLGSYVHTHTLFEKPRIGFAELPKEGSTWIDPFIRLADYFASPLASIDYNRKDGKIFTTEKYLPLVSAVLPENDRIAVIKITFNPHMVNLIQFKRGQPPLA